MARIHFKKLCAPGPSGQRGEHAEQTYNLKHETFKSRWFRALDELTARAMQGTLSRLMRLDPTHLTNLVGNQQGTQLEADDYEEATWIQIWREEESRQQGGDAMAAWI